MELGDALFNPAAVARGLRRRVGRTMRRLTGRGAMALPSEGEFLALFGDRYRRIDDLLAAFAQASGRLFVTDISPHATAELFAVRFPDRRRRIIEFADRTCAHRFDLLGSGPRDLGPRLPWHTDFKSGHVWDRSADHQELNERMVREFGSGWDIKVPWELSRFQHLPGLGQAYWLTGEMRFYAEFRDQVTDWIDSNRVGFGVNWICTMDVAIRAVNWIWAWAFFRREIVMEREFASLLLRTLFAHGRFISANLENEMPVPNNHYVADLVGLLFLGVLFRDASEADRWRGMAIGAIEKEVGRQTYEDGVDYEASIAYHRMMTEMALTSMLLLERCEFRLPILRHRVRRMLEFVAHYLKPNGLAPQIGDNDDGRLQILGEYDADRRDHRSLLAIGGCAFEDRSLLEVAGGRWEEAFWLLGPNRLPPEAFAASGKGVQITSRTFADSGIAILRHADLYAVLDAGPVGLNGHGGHAHNDTLSVEIQAAGVDLIVDPGTGCYTPDLELRNRFRSTAAHNGIRVDGEEINPLSKRPFELTALDEPSIDRWVSRRGFDLIEAQHQGYRRLPDPVLHRRVLLLNKSTRRFVIEDIVQGRDHHRLEWFFHLAPGCEVVLDADGRTARCRIDEVSFVIAPTALPEDAVAHIETGEYSPGYGRVLAAPVLRYEWSGRLPVTTRIVVALERDLADGALRAQEKSR